VSTSVGAGFAAGYLIVGIAWCVSMEDNRAIYRKAMGFGGVPLAWVVTFCWPWVAYRVIRMKG
jgi:hypothetical protein